MDVDVSESRGLTDVSASDPAVALNNIPEICSALSANEYNIFGAKSRGKEKDWLKKKESPQIRRL